MKNSRMSVLVVDHQIYWRECAAEALRRKGYQISTTETYEEAMLRVEEGASWNIVLLGCATVESKEYRLIDYLVARGQPVIVLSTSLSVQKMRNLFLQGVADVTDKTYHQANIIAIVEEAQELITHRDRSWEPAEKGGFHEQTAGTYSGH
jgi:DNA-binding NtrC family response regulator